MAKTAGDVLIEVLLECGVEVIFGLPGDGINGIMEALRKRQDQIRFIHVRHEEAAAFMACAATPNSPADWACAWQPPALVASTCSMGSTTPSWTGNRCWPLP